MLSNSKKQQGFTIVELLIVIVVIAILAAISIVAYNGIQDRGKSSAAQSLANNIAKKVEAYNTIESSYPSFSQLTTNTGAGTAGNSKEAKLDDVGVVMTYTAGNSSSGQVGHADTYLNGSKNRVVYRQVTNGACIWWWNYSSSASAKQTLITIGSATSGDCTA